MPGGSIDVAVAWFPAFARGGFGVSGVNGVKKAVANDRLLTLGNGELLPETGGLVSPVFGNPFCRRDACGVNRLGGLTPDDCARTLCGVGHSRFLQNFFVSGHFQRLFHVDEFHAHFTGAAQ